MMSVLADIQQFVGFTQIQYIVIGVILGTIIGALPGCGPMMGVTLTIPFTFYLDPVSSLALLIGIYQGGSFGGAISAALVGIPGTPIAAATLLDAYPMSQSGRASEAITLATVASWFGGCFGGIVLLVAAPSLASFALSFGPAERLGLALIGLTAIASLSAGSTVKGLMSGALGLMLATVGSDPFTGTNRFDIGIPELTGGLTFVSLLVGLFAISEMLIQLESTTPTARITEKIRFSTKCLWTLISDSGNYLRSSLIGVLVGVVPGVGGVSSAFLSYKISKDLSPDKDQYGKGALGGVVATEAANSATTGGALLPMLSLGIPGDPIVAVMMGGLLIHGVTPGPAFMLTNAPMLNGILGIFLIGAFLLLPIGWLLLPVFVRILSIPKSFLTTFILALCIFGTYATNRELFDIWLLWVFGFLGYAMRKGGVPLSPLVIGFVLGPIVEESLRRLATISGGNFWGFLIGRPIALTCFVLILAMLIGPILAQMYRTRSNEKRS
ncbi:tripartite tricarboxylate transporter permease [Amylibacter sp.]|nr:tripartite tricarboxylate transporter permease [Amylibacter sp.]